MSLFLLKVLILCILRARFISQVNKAVILLFSIHLGSWLWMLFSIDLFHCSLKWKVVGSNSSIFDGLEVVHDVAGSWSMTSIYIDNGELKMSCYFHHGRAWSINCFPNNYAESFIYYEEESLLGVQENYVIAFCFSFWMILWLLWVPLNPKFNYLIDFFFIIINY